MKRIRLLTAIFVLGFFFGGSGAAEAVPPLVGMPVYPVYHDSFPAFPTLSRPVILGMNPRQDPNVAKYGMTRSEIRSLPITERPNRPGHFYGNAVRRRAGINE